MRSLLIITSTIVLILSLLTITGMAQSPDPETLEGKTRVACVGDSITFGAAIKDRKNNSYPAQLQKRLGDKWAVGNFGVSGATMLKQGNKPYWKQARYTKALEFKPNIVIIKLGTNDTKPGNWKHKDQFKEDYAAMIDSFAELESKPTIYICTPAPVAKDRWGINEATVVNDSIPAIRDIADKKGVKVIDIYSALKGKDELLPDGVHPNAEGAGIIAELVHDTLTRQ